MNVKNVLIDRIDNLRQQNAAAERGLHQSEPSADTKNNRAPSRQRVLESVDQLNRASNQLNERLSFSYNEKVNRVIVKVINGSTNEVIREIPPKDIIKLVEHIQHYLGMIVDESR
ncbi:MAG: flagellar protein FlaG [Spirochaetes bacterium]|nr:flagellar protein FlaG [Spirochaetota bacterium]